MEREGILLPLGVGLVCAVLCCAVLCCAVLVWPFGTTVALLLGTWR
jgi:hypothetical protein